MAATLLSMFARKGTGGRIMYGYRQIAVVRDWTYHPEQPHGEGPAGAGTVACVLDEVNPLWASQSDVTLELRSKDQILRWETAELLGETVIVPGPPVVRRAG